ncbi:AhpC/TSA family protein [Parabacteroides sp. PF5-9]|uniref:AhpC/TSA family protein n=1 Tax=Parabacteroides sp. PF5-9 TaxID=1742404 RepID=UPI002473D536|nr:AhpC/TSA family protein [Parabacteroides sp. PF5-9]MDH6358444.1 peroxiredoxin [Parabacteroides sp. PF5-9]
MKKYFYLLTTALLLVACAQQPGYKISGTVSNADLNGKYIYLYEYNKSIENPLDSTLVENGKFTFKGDQLTPTLGVIEFTSKDFEPQRAQTGLNAPYKAIFVLENGQLTVDLNETPTVTGTPENNDWATLQTELLKGLTTEHEDEEAAYRQLMSLVQQYIQNHPDNVSSAKLVYDFRHSLEEDFRRQAINNSGDLFKSVAGVDKLIEHLATLEKVAIGKKFTDFEMADPKGNAIKLSDYVGKGKVVLIDFWASWCPPCRRDMPHLVEVYKQYKGKKFEVVGVSLDRTHDAWVKGIEELNITWPQMSDLKYWQCEGAALYGVNSIPHTVLIDGDGTIIAKNLSGELLDAKLAEILK